MKLNHSYQFIECSPAAARAIKEACLFQDKTIYLQYRNQGYTTFQAENAATVNLTVTKSNGITIPAGFLNLPAVKEAIKQNPSIKIEKPTQPEKDLAVDLDDTLQSLGLDRCEHQINALNKLFDEMRGCVVLPTGTGKSNIIALYIKHFPGKTFLVMVPRIEILNQMRDTLKFVLGETIGQLGGGKKDKRRVTVGIYKTTLSGEHDMYLKSVDGLIIDESHLCPGNQVELNNLCIEASLRAAFTATPHTDGRQYYTYSVVGPEIYREPRAQLEDKNIILRPTIYYITYKHNNKSPYYQDLGLRGDTSSHAFGGYVRGKGYRQISGGFGPNPLDVEHYKTCCTENYSRNQIILDLVKAFVEWEARTGPGIVFTGYVDHSNKLNSDLLDVGIRSATVSSKTKGTERQKIYDKAKQSCAGLAGVNNPNSLDVIVAADLLNAGVDIRSLMFAMLTEVTQNPQTTIQRIGRILRTPRGSEQKKRAIVVAFVDEESVYYSKRSDSLKTLLKEEFRKSQHVHITPEELIEKFKNNTV